MGIWSNTALVEFDWSLNILGHIPNHGKQKEKQGPFLGTAGGNLSWCLIKAITNLSCESLTWGPRWRRASRCMELTGLLESLQSFTSGDFQSSGPVSKGENTRSVTQCSFPDPHLVDGSSQPVMSHVAASTPLPTLPSTVLEGGMQHLGQRHQGRPLQGLRSAESFYLKNLVLWHLSKAFDLVCRETTLFKKRKKKQLSLFSHSDFLKLCGVQVNHFHCKSHKLYGDKCCSP